MPIDKKTIHSYSKYAKQWAQRMRAGNNFAHDYLEKPASIVFPVTGFKKENRSLYRVRDG